MWADDVEELHEMATRLGLKYVWFQTEARTGLDHYDLVPSKRKDALKYGAIKADLAEWMQLQRGLLKEHELKEDSLLGIHLKKKAEQGELG
jgi:hypothetical protein